MPRTADEIEFTDLHGVPDGQSSVEVELDDEGITRKPRLAPDGESGDPFEPGNNLEVTVERGRDQDGAGSQDDDDYSKKVQARIKREQRAKAKERNARLAAEERADAAERKLRANERKAREIDVEGLDRQIGELETDLEAAIEAGDTKKHVKLTSQLTDLKAKRVAAAYVNVDDPDDDADSDVSRGTPRNEALGDWLDNHGDWFNQKGFETQTLAAKRLDKELVKEGLDPTTDEYFEELDKRLRKRHPDVYAGLEAFDDELGGDDDPPPSREKGRSPVAGVGDGSATQSKSRDTSSNRVTLDEDDLRNMENFGLDTSDPEVLKEYARNKRQAEMEEQQR